MERQIGIGVIGMGWMGRVHSAAYRRLPEHFPDLGVRPRLAMAADVSPDRRAHAARVGFERTTGDWRAVIDDPEVEIVNVTLPNVMHREVATAALQAGKHLWVEKPVGRGVGGDDRRRRGRREGRRRQRGGLLLPLRAGRRARAA
jgi:predicted dehydrogenase